MQPVTRRVARPLVRLALAALMTLAVVLVAGQGTAQAQTGADPDYWKGTAERQNTVNRLIYSQSPQAIPPSYELVREEEERLRQLVRSLPPSNPQSQPIWKRLVETGRRVGLTPATRTLGTIGLAVGTFELGWKIGTGVNAKFLRIGIPPAADGPMSYRWDRIEWAPAGSRSYAGALYPTADGWLISARQMCCTGARIDRWFGEPCPFTGFVPPAPFITQGAIPSTAQCSTPQGLAPVDVYYGWAPEDTFSLLGPVEPFTNQPYNASSAAPTPPTQSTVEQAIETELDKPENQLLRDYLNYALGSPGAEDPTGVGEPLPDIAFPGFVEHWEDHGGEFATPYDDPVEYWRDAADIVKRGRNGDLEVESCHRDEDPADLFWDVDKGAIVVVKDGKIVTYFKPPDGIDYFDRECNK